MKQTVEICNMTGLDSSLRELETAKLVILMAPSPVFKDCVQRMGDLIPTVTNIGVCGQGYYELKDHPEDIILIGYYECEAVADVIADVTKPILSVQKMKEHMNAIQANAKNTVCLDFTTGNDSVIVTTLNACLSERDIALIGATAWDNKVSFNGRLYENACVYALLKNTNGTIRAYMENIYVLDENMRVLSLQRSMRQARRSLRSTVKARPLYIRRHWGSGRVILRARHLRILSDARWARIFTLSRSRAIVLTEVWNATNAQIIWIHLRSSGWEIMMPSSRTPYRRLKAICRPSKEYFRSTVFSVI